MPEAALSGDQHAAHYLALAEEVAVRLTGDERGDSLDRLAKEFDHLLAALRWFAQNDQLEQAWRLTIALWDFWRWRLDEGRRWVDEFLALPQLVTQAALRAQALDLAGVLAFYSVIRNDDPQSSAARSDRLATRALMEESLSLRRELGDR